MKVEEVTNQIKQVREGKGDFTSLIDRIHSQTLSKKKVVPITAVNNARRLGHELNKIS